MKGEEADSAKRVESNSVVDSVINNRKTKKNVESRLRTSVDDLKLARKRIKEGKLMKNRGGSAGMEVFVMRSEYEHQTREIKKEAQKNEPSEQLINEIEQENEIETKETLSDDELLEILDQFEIKKNLQRELEVELANLSIQ
ncbi:hypothetical protein TPHA_0E00810 [Tetrapisispora phaffii CBS 4417]|uniref:Uncharacterized protein n=1 Tax=Tetrapisispora phaffii (strain ATCC 24235 / CBS 4417 / NBRC 1672 / NRRL Y-8282 / UCD 70-5) TaxID=1071381 RepID=G8BTE8_TETPH|nr:hypothetical protein TPHA_0E00810 [Tetrapisispora phaffii CBS 4417]CCE63176.1 hypothetical protein TPHA_0E00810 [Tetrapisispora phaffii CBS 4417]